MTSFLGFFWFFLAIAFFAMAWKTYKLRQIIVPKSIEEASKAAYFRGADVAKIKPIFDHILTIEIIAFLLTGITALIEFLVR